MIYYSNSVVCFWTEHFGLYSKRREKELTIHVTAAELNIVADKTIVLTGAMKPEKFADTDAHFNVGMAVGAVLTLPPGVYIALYGEVVAWDEFVPR